MSNRYELQEDSLERREKAEQVMGLLKFMHKSEIHLLEQDYEGGYDVEDLAYPFLENDDRTTDKRKRVSFYWHVIKFNLPQH